MIWEASTENKLEALSIHRSFLEREIDRNPSDPVAVSAELNRVKDLQAAMVRVKNHPTDHLVVVVKSRKVMFGSVGRVVYANLERNHCRVQFGNGERVSCALSGVEVIDWDPLPAMIPMVGERVINRQTGEEVVVAEWRVSEVRVQPPGLPEDTYTLDREYVSRKESVINM